MDKRIRIRKGKQTVRITVTITNEQHTRLKALAAANGFNTSELARYALVQLFKQPYIFYLVDVGVISNRCPRTLVLSLVGERR